MKIKDLKTALRENDYFGDRWSVAMGAFFDVAAQTYEIADTPSDWEFQVGLAGNVI